MIDAGIGEFYVCCTAPRACIPPQVLLLAAGDVCNCQRFIPAGMVLLYYQWDVWLMFLKKFCIISMAR